MRERAASTSRRKEPCAPRPTVRLLHLKVDHLHQLVHRTNLSLESILESQQEVAEALRQAATVMDKVGGEIDAIKTLAEDLKAKLDAAEASGGVDPELKDAAQAIVDKAAGLDSKNPDASPPPEPPTEEEPTV